MGRLQGGLKVIALISGGKDSFFSLLHCLANEHEVVALANLQPQAAENSDDLNSFMYQTVGHTLIPLYESALDLPLYRQEITGTARDVSKAYDGSVMEQKDGKDQVEETECLVPLLKKIVSNHPQATALCSGAILSTYQRTRIEAIALRLGLIPLSYLWQYPILPPPSPGGLLEDMATVGFAVRIVKVASGGLDDSLLWCDLMDPSVRKKVEKNMRRFGGSVLGEGGEYETLVTDGPREIWKGSLDVDEQAIHRRLDYGSGGAAWIAFENGSGKVVSQQYEGRAQNWRQRLRKVDLWDQEFLQVLKRILIDGPLNWMAQETEDRQALLSVKLEQWEAKAVHHRSAYTLNLSNLTAISAGGNAVDQMMEINRDLLFVLRAYNCTIRDIVFTTIVLTSMSDYTSVNTLYAKDFQLNPPARVTVAINLPPKVSVMVSYVVSLDADRTGDALHVQSRSYWTPANIGPYSQATSIRINDEAVSSLVYVAGQIPLVPATMQVLKAEEERFLTSDKEKDLHLFCRQSCLSLQHLWRVGREMQVGWWTGAVAFIAGEKQVKSKSMLAYQIWKDLHSKSLWETEVPELQAFDVWDLKNGGPGALGKDAEIQDLPDFLSLSDTEHGIPGFFAVQVDELPRGCDIEWQGLGSTNSEVRVSSIVYDDFETSSVSLLSTHYSIVFISVYQSSNSVVLTDIMERAQFDNPYSITIYTPRPAFFAQEDAQIIPCRTIWGCEGVELAAGIVLHFDSSRHMNLR